MSVSTHVLDAALGRPAVGVPVALTGPGGLIAESTTDSDGRVAALAGHVAVGTYRLRFDLDAYRPGGFYPEVVVAFRVTDPAAHHHVPLLLSPFAYSTYRGS